MSAKKQQQNHPPNRAQQQKGPPDHANKPDKPPGQTEEAPPHLEVYGTGPHASAPPHAVAMGYTKLGFSDDFTSPPDIGYGENDLNHKWSAGMWWYPPPPQDCYVWDGNTGLTIFVKDFEGGPGNHVDLCTQFRDHETGAKFLHGYFEARMQVWNWAAFWLFCWNRPKVWGDKIDPNNPMTWTNEIDIIEGDPGYSNRAFCTLHKNTSSEGGVPDQQNDPNWFNTQTFLSGYWHNYGVLWHPNFITWFIDDIPLLTLDPYESTNQACQLILTAGDGGVGGSQSTKHPSQVKIDWVQAWVP